MLFENDLQWPVEKQCVCCGGHMVWHKDKVGRRPPPIRSICFVRERAEVDLITANPKTAQVSSGVRSRVRSSVTLFIQERCWTFPGVSVCVYWKSSNHQNHTSIVYIICPEVTAKSLRRRRRTKKWLNWRIKWLIIKLFGMTSFKFVVFLALHYGPKLL